MLKSNAQVLDGHEFVQGLGVGDGQRSLVCCSPWDCKESDTTEQLNLTKLKIKPSIFKKKFQQKFVFETQEIRDWKQCKKKPGC